MLRVVSHLLVLTSTVAGAFQLAESLGLKPESMKSRWASTNSNWRTHFRLTGIRKERTFVTFVYHVTLSRVLLTK